MTDTSGIMLSIHQIGSMTRSEYILRCAEAALSPRVADERADELFKIAPNPWEPGRTNQMQMWMRCWQDQSRGLIWC